MLMTLFAFALTIAVLVVIHEYGHYRAAVACDVKVLRFSVGFGRTLFKRQRGETEFVLSALPLGGYVKMLDAREGPVPPAEQHRAFNNKPLRQRAFIVAAGPLANLVLAVLLYSAVNWLGVEELRARVAMPAPASLLAQAGLQSGDDIVALAQADAPDDWQTVRSFTDLQWLLTAATVDKQDVRLKVSRERQGQMETVLLDVHTTQIAPGEVDANLMERLGLPGPYAPAVVGSVLVGGPAEKAGLRKADLVLAFNGRPVPDAATLRGWIASSGGSQIVFQVERAGALTDVRVKPVVVQEGDTQRARIRAELGGDVDRVTVRYGFAQGMLQAVRKTWDVSAMSLNMLGKMLVGEASLRNLSGPISIADYAGKSAQLGLTYYLGFLALVSVSLGVLNLLPLPVLDGGHLMYYLFEALSGRPIPDVWLERLQRGGVAVMLLMMSLALYNDFARLLGMH